MCQICNGETCITGCMPPQGCLNEENELNVRIGHADRREAQGSWQAKNWAEKLRRRLHVIQAQQDSVASTPKFKISDQIVKWAGKFVRGFMEN